MSYARRFWRLEQWRDHKKARPLVNHSITIEEFPFSKLLFEFVLAKYWSSGRVEGRYRRTGQIPTLLVSIKCPSACVAQNSAFKKKKSLIFHHWMTAEFDVHWREKPSYMNHHQVLWVAEGKQKHLWRKSYPQHLQMMLHPQYCLDSHWGLVLGHPTDNKNYVK